MNLENLIEELLSMKNGHQTFDLGAENCIVDSPRFDLWAESYTKDESWGVDLRAADCK